MTRLKFEKMVALATVLLFAACAVKHEPSTAIVSSESVGITDSEIVIGQAAAFSGPSAGLGIEMWRGVSAAFEEANAQGGIHGRKLRLVVADDGYDAEKAADAVTKLLDEDRVFALGFGVGTPTIVKALPVVKQHFEKDGVFYFANFTGAQPQRTPPFDACVFNVRASYFAETAAMVDVFVAAGRSKIGIFLQDDAYGEDGRAGVIRALKQKGLAPVAEARYPRGQTVDVSTAAKVKILRDAGADAVIMVGAYQASAAFIRDARMANWDVPIHSVSFVGASLMEGVLGAEEARTGKTLRTRVIVTEVMPSPAQTDTPIVADYRAALDKHARPLPAGVDGGGYKRPSAYSFVSLEGYVSARVFLAALKKAGRDVTRRSLYKIIEGMGRFDLGLGVPLEFSSSRHQALDNIWFTYLTADGWKQTDDPAAVIRAK